VKAKKYTELNSGGTDTVTLPFTGVGDRTVYLIGSKEYLYDVHDQLIGTEQYSEDGLGQQLFETRKYVYERGHCAVEFVVNPSIDDIAYRLYGPGVDMPLAIDWPDTYNSPIWTLTDHQGTVRDLAGSWVDGTFRHEHVQYTPFGVPTASGGLPSGVSSFYAGRELDRFTGLYNNRARWYDAGCGRFISEDPIGFAGGDANLYRYCGNSPANATDPSGNSFTLGLGIAGGAIGFVAGGLSGEGGWDWSRAWAGAGSGALIGAGIGLAIDSFGAATPLSAAMVGAGVGATIGAGVGSAVGGGLVTSRESVDLGGYGKGAVVGGVFGGVAGAAYPLIGAAASSSYVGAFATGAGSMMLGDAAGQGTELALGWRSSYSTGQTAFAGATGGVFSVGGHAIGQALSRVRAAAATARPGGRWVSAGRSGGAYWEHNVSPRGMLDRIGNANLPYRTPVTAAVRLSRFFATRTGYQQVIAKSPLTRHLQQRLGWQVHHWAIPQSAARGSGSEGLRRITHAGWNLIPLPARVNNAISNQGIGNNAVRVLVGTSPVTAGVGGYAVGSSIYDIAAWAMGDSE